MFDIVRLKAIIILPQRKEHKTMSKENKLKKFVKNEGCQYFKYAMLSFGGLGLEGIYAYLLEPLFYGHSINEFTTPEWILHWSITIITWLMVAYLIIRSARNNLNFQLKGINSKWTPVGIIASCILIGLMVVSNFIDLGQLKIVHEFQALGILKFVFPGMMVAGALGSLVVNIISKGDWPTSLQWVGASLLYTALLFRNK